MEEASEMSRSLAASVGDIDNEWVTLDDESEDGEVLVRIGVFNVRFCNEEVKAGVPRFTLDHWIRPNDDESADDIQP